MAIKKLTDTDISSLVNLAYAEMLGQTTLEEKLPLNAFTDNGTNEIGADLREKWFGKLLGVATKMMFTDSSYVPEADDPYYEDAQKFGAITQLVHAEIPEAKVNSAWKDFVAGTTKVGVYDIFLPIVDNRLFIKSESFAIPVSITGEQLDTAFKNEGELSSFVSYIFMQMTSAIACHRQNMTEANRTNFIAQKIYATNQLEDGVHVVDLVAKFVADRGITTALSVTEFMSRQDCLLYAIEQINLYSQYMRRMNTNFNVGGKKRFTPRERLVCEMLSAFEERLKVVAQSDVYHRDLVELPLHKSVPAWQSVGDYSFDSVSGIAVTIADPKTPTTTHDVEQSGIIAFLADKWAILHTIRSQRVAHQRFDIEDIDLYEYQYRDSYMNDLTNQAVVFVVNDYTPA